MAAGGCDRCGAANPAHARFCMACGAPCARRCPSCGALAEPGARYCVGCGGALGEVPGAAAAAPAPPAAEERRTVTVLFADLVGYTTIAESLDHESVKSLTDRYLTRLALEVERFGGYVDQYIGDNVMAVFGAPVAHEDDPARAVRAACGMQAAMMELNRTVAADFGLTLSLRVGINTGEVLAGRIGAEYTVVGDAVNVAARLQTNAAVGRILVGDRTRHATAGTVAYRQVGPLVLKGKSNPVNAWEVEPGTLAHRLSRERLRAPLIGRAAELGTLLAAVERVVHERLPRLVAVLGEPGVGKTRLVAELERRLARHDPAVHFMRGAAAGFGDAAAFGPFAEMLRAELGIAPDDDAGQVRARLLERFGEVLGDPRLQLDPEQRLAPLARLLSGGGADAPGAPPSDERSARAAFFAAVRALLESQARDRIPVLLWEDAHWADEGTLELIDYLDEWVQAPLLQLCVGREELLERRGGWGGAGQRSERLVLAPLDAQYTRALMEAIVARRGTQPEDLSRLAHRSGGNPLFAEALVESLAEPGGADPSALPDTVQSLLAARLDRITPPERRLLGHAAVVGVTFATEALRGVAQAAGDDTEAVLARLSERNLIAPLESPGGPAAWTFRHVLVREAAYEMLPKAVRARKHAAVAEMLEADRDVSRQSAIADHFARAAALGAEVHLPRGEVAQMRHRALRHTIAAGDQAAQLFSNRDALARYRAAAELCDAGDATGFEIAEKRGEIEFRLGHMDGAIEAWQACQEHHRAAGDVEHAAELHRKVAAAMVHSGDRDAAIKQLQRGINMVKGRPASLSVARLYGEAATLYMQLGAQMLAVYAAERALAFAESLAEPRAASRAHAIYGSVYGTLGDRSKARASLARAVDVVRDSDPGETILALAALAHHLERHECDQQGAIARYAEALRIAERIGDVPQQVEMRASLARLALDRCQWDAASQDAERAAALAESEGLPGKLCLVALLRGRLRWREGAWEEAAELLAGAREGADLHGRTDVAGAALLWLAATHRESGALEVAAAELREAIALSERAGLTALAVEASSALVLVETLAGRSDGAEEAASRARRHAARAHDPVSAVAAAEAAALVASPQDAAELLARVGGKWERLGRGSDAVRCAAGRALRLRSADPAAARALAEQLASRCARLGLPLPAFAPGAATLGAPARGR